MKNRQITKEELGSYINCELEVLSSGHCEPPKSITDMLIVWNDYGKISLGSLCEEINSGAIELSLRPPESITREEWEGIFEKGASIKSGNVYVGKRKVACVGNGYISIKFSKADFFTSAISIIVLHRLWKLGVDTFGLIPDGVAKVLK